MKKIVLTHFSLLIKNLFFAVLVIIVVLKGSCYDCYAGGEELLLNENMHGDELYKSINKTFGKDISVKDNAVVFILKRTDPLILSDVCRKHYISILNYDFTKEALECHFVDWDDYFFKDHKFHDLYKRYRNHDPSLFGPPAYPEIPDYDEFDTLLTSNSEIYFSCLNNPWTRENNPRLFDWLASNERALEGIIEASKKKHYFYPAIRGDKGLCPRLYIDALIIRAMLAVGELRYEDAWEDMLACHRFVFLARSGCYCASEIDNMYFARTKQVFQVELLLLEHLKNLDSRKIDQIRDELFRLPKENKNVRLFDLGERFVCMENLEEAISGKFAFTFELSQGTYSQEELKIMLDEAKPLINESVDTIIKALKEPNYQQRMTLLRPLEVRLNKQYPIGILTTDKLAAYAAPHHNYLKNDVACLMREKLVEVAIVLEDYNRNNHGYPNTLKQLIPNYISEVPNDEYNGKKIKYTHKDKGYLLYSVGENGNDDTLEVENNEKRLSNESDDIVIAHSWSI